MSDTSNIVAIRSVKGQMKVVGGTDMDGPGTPVWSDEENGVDRVLMGARGLGMKTVVVAGIFEDGQLYVACNNGSAEFALGLLERAKIVIIDSAAADAEHACECEDDGA